MNARLLVLLPSLWSGYLGHNSFAAPLEEIVLADGQLADRWDAGIGAFDEAIGYGNCMNDGGAGCPTVDWGWVKNPEKGSVLRASWASNGQHAGVYFQSSTPQDFSTYAKGYLEFDIRTLTQEQFNFRFDTVISLSIPQLPVPVNLTLKQIQRWEK